MALLLPFFILVPLAGFLLSLLVPANRKGLISFWAASVVGAHFWGAVAFVIYWLSQGHPLLHAQPIDLYQAGNYSFFVDYYFDRITVAYLSVGALLTLVVTFRSRYHLAPESNHKRFFSTVLFFYLGYNLVIFAGNLDTAFIGWELLSIASFLLIAFYRDRYLPVKNALKFFSIYRIGDVGMVMALWMSHCLWLGNVPFYKLNNMDLVHEHFQTPTVMGAFVSLMILVAAAARSAQLPFSSWLPRAMEGSPPPSATLYGSLSVHIGVFLLFRTLPFWENQLSVTWLIGLVGLLTSLVATLTARVQSSVNSRIAYSSIAQTGLIFMEVAGGFHTLALIHFAGNAFLRTYQLLVAPTVVSHAIQAQLYSFTSRPRAIETTWPRRLTLTVYMLSLREWNLDSILYQSLWNPMKWLGRKMNFMTVRWVLLFLVPGYLLFLILMFYQEIIPRGLSEYLPSVLALVGMILVMKAFTEPKAVWLSWLLVVLNHLWIVLAVNFNERFIANQICYYLSGVFVGGIAGLLCLKQLYHLEKDIDLARFHGHIYKHPKIALLFLIACLGLAGFPITPTFIGKNFIFTHIHEDQAFLALITSLSFIVNGLAIIRIYARVFLGPHSKSSHEMAYRSS